MSIPILNEEECKKRWKKIREPMRKRGLGCLVVVGTFGRHRDLYANLRYLSNADPVTMEGYLVFPLEAEPTLITFMGRARAHPSWIEDHRAGHPIYSKAISERLRELHLESSRIGVVGLSGYYGELGFSHATYMSLTNNFPGAKFEDATDIVEEARRIKSPAEIRCLEIGCEVGEKVIQAVIDTAKVGVTDQEIKLKVMETVFRNGCDFASMLFLSSGREITHGGQDQLQSPPRALEQGDVILTEFDARYFGYKAQYNQPFSVGEPSKDWREIFNVALEAFNSGFKALRPGITIGELDEAFISPIREAGYVRTNPAFHGLGLGIEEPVGNYPRQPDYKPKTSFKIEAGMVIEFEPSVVTSDGKRGLTLGSPVLVTETGCRLLSKSWKPEFRIA